MGRVARQVAAWLWLPEGHRRRQRYLRASRRPLECLLFMAPLAALYEIWELLADDAAAPAENLLAHGAISGVLEWFGFTGAWVPPLALVVVMLVWHRLKGDRWRVRGWVFFGMACESLMLAIPLLVLSAFFSPRTDGTALLPGRLPVALGAGVYEELVFRLLLVGTLTWVLTKVMRVWRPVAVVVAVGLGALGFAFCHFAPIGSEALVGRSFWFRVAAGVYLGAVFAGRGVGVSCGCHAAHNVVLAWLQGATGA